MWRKLLSVLMLFCAVTASYAADGYFVRGIVRDSVTMEPLPYASVLIPGSATGAVADSKGIFEISVPSKTKALIITCMGYEKKTLPLKRDRYNMYVAYMIPSSTELNEVVVRKQKYSKKNNPAVDFLNRIKDQASLTDPRRNPYYSYRKYERIVMGLNDFSVDDHQSMMRRMPELAQHVDTSEVSGKPYLSFLVKEKTADVYYRKSPGDEKEIVEGMRAEGIDDFVDPASMRIFLEDIMREINLYDNDITLLQNRFVSPLSRIAADFYKFYLTDTVQVGDERCIVLSFYPHNHAAFGFIGHVYVPEGDTTMFIKRVEMKIPRDINLNFIDNLYITQTFDRAPDGSRLITSDEMTVELSLVGKKPGMYLSRRSAYGDHSFDTIADSVFSGAAPSTVLADASARDDSYWRQARLTAIKPGENAVGKLMERLRGIPLYYWGEKIVKVLFSGYIMTGNPSKFDVGPVNAMMSFNSTEGTRLRLGGMSTSALSKRWFTRFYGAYGFKDHKWKYGAEVEYSFIDKDYHSREFPVKSLRLTSSYDIERPGQNYLFTTADNIVLSLKRLDDDRIVYKRLNELRYTLETSYNFTFGLTLANIRREAAPVMPFVDGYGNTYSHLNENSVELLLRYAPGEKFFQTRSYRIPVNLDAPAITLRHTFSPKGFGGSRYAVNVTELDITKRWWFSAFGYLDTYIGAGHVWSRSSFLNLLIPNANLSYIIQPQSFALMNPMEFINSSYASFDITYWANGAIFNYIPYLKKLKLREVFAFRGIWGHLADRDNPDCDPSLLRFPADAGLTHLTHGPYMEASVGIENIFKVLRVDYVWRLNYRNVPYKIDRSGIRIAVHVTF